MRAVIYSRISQDRDGDAIGVDRQELECIEHIRRMGWQHTGTYRDNDRSAYRGRRPQFERLLDDLPAIDVIVVWSADRLYRRIADLERLVDVLGKTKVDALRSGDINLSTADGKAVARILGSLAQRESEKMGERVAAAYATRAAAGGWTGGPRRLGYNRDCTELVEHEADLIRWAYGHIDSGGSVNSVVRRWNAEGMVGPLGGRIHAEQVRATLKRPRNCGLASYKGQIVGETKSSPTIIDKETWQRVTSRLANNKGPGSVERTLLSGIAVCGECGGPVRAMVRHWKGKNPQPAYRCHERYCASRKREMLDDYVTARVLAILTADRDQILAAIRPQAVGDPAEPLRKELRALGAMVASGQLGALAYAEAAGPLEERIAQLETAPSGTPAASVQAILRSPDIRAAWQDSDVQVQREVLKTLIDSVVVPKHPSKVRIEWKSVAA